MTETLKMTIQEMQDILEEIWGILRIGAFAFWNVQPTVENLFRLDQRLQQVQRKAAQLQSDELSTWLVYTHNWSDSLPTWKPLFDTSYVIMLQRHPRDMVEHNLLGGLFPKDSR